MIAKDVAIITMMITENRRTQDFTMEGMDPRIF